MALKKVNVPINFGQGIQQKDDSKLVVPGKMVELNNAVFRKTGRTSKREGNRLLNNTITDGSTITSGKAINTWNDELNICDGVDFFSYLPSNQTWIDKGNAVSCIIKSSSIIQNDSVHSNVTSAVNSGLVCTTYMVGSNINYTLKDLSSQTTIVYDSLISSSGARPLVIAFINYFVIFYTIGTNLNYKLISINTPTVLGSQVNLVTDTKSTEPLYDAKVVGDYIWIVYNDDNTDVVLVRVNYIFSVSLPTIVSGSSATNSMTIFSDDDQNVWLSWFDGTDILSSIYDYNMVELVGEVVLDTPSDDVLNITGFVNGTTAQIIYEVDAALSYNHFLKSNTLTLAGTPGTAINLVLSVGLASKCFFVNNRGYFTAIYQSSQQSTYFIIDQDANIVGKISPASGGDLILDTPLTEANSYLDSFVVSTGIKTVILTQDDSVFTNLGIQYSLVDFSSENQFQSQTLNNLFLVGGVLQTYDGVSLVEQNFHLFPENIGLVSSTSGGSITNGTRQYRVCFEWTDNLGQIMRSSPSEAIDVTNTGSNVSKNTLTIPTLRLTAKQGDRSSVRIVIYRTEDAGEIFYRITSITSPLLNSTTVDTVTYEDTAADSTIIGNDVLYTTGGVVENSAPPNCSMITTFKNQVVIGGLENKLQLWVSKPKKPGYTVEFSDFFTIQVDPFGGDMTAISRLDDKIVIFKYGSIYYAAGDGFNETGTQNTLQEPILITSDVGCININSVVIVPDGLMFRSAKGIYLLSRGLEVVYIGAPVEDYNSLTISSSVLVADENHVRFTTEEGRTLVYDYLYKQWSTFTNEKAIDSVVYLNKFVFLNNSGRAYLDETGRYNDNGSYIPLSMTTGWISFDDPQVFQRIYQILLVGEYKSAHKLKVSVRYNYNPIFVEETIIDVPELMEGTEDLFGDQTYGSTSPYGTGVYGGLYPVYQFRINLGRQRCEAISFKIEDIQDGLTIGEGFNLTNILFRVGVTNNFFKFSSSLSAGTTS